MRAGGNTASFLMLRNKLKMGTADWLLGRRHSLYLCFLHGPTTIVDVMIFLQRLLLSFTNYFFLNDTIILSRDIDISKMHVVVF